MQNTGRLHSLDAVRACALLLGIVLHGTLPYLQGIKGYVCTDMPSDTLAAVWYIIHIFRMPVFFLIAGYFGRLVIERKGTKAFIKDRSKRILVPLLVGYPVVMILTVGALILGCFAGGIDPRSILEPVQRESASSGFTWAHLWFLYYLIIFYVCVLGIRAMFHSVLDRGDRIRRLLDAIVQSVMKSGWAPIVMALPFIAYFYNLDGWASGTGLPGPFKLAPQISAFVGYGIPFGLGWLLHRQTHLLLALEKSWLAYCTSAVVLTFACYMIAGPQIRWEAYLQGLKLLMYTAAYMVCIWCWVFGLIGISIRFLSKESAVRRYISDSSYWLYLMHVPVQVFFHVLFATFNWHWSIKYLLMLVISTSILLLSYHYMVRFTFIGATLNGRRHARVGLKTNVCATA